MAIETIVAIVTAIIICACYLIGTLLKLFRWLKIEPSDVKNFIVIRGRPIAWNLYRAVAITFTIYFLLVLSLVISFLPFTISLVTFIVLIIWALLGIWSPAIQKYFEGKRVSVGLQVASYSLITLTVVLFWFVQYPEIQTPLFVTLLLVLVFVILIVDSVYKRLKARKSR